MDLPQDIETSGMQLGICINDIITALGYLSNNKNEFCPEGMEMPAKQKEKVLRQLDKILKCLKQIDGLIKDFNTYLEAKLTIPRSI